MILKSSPIDQNQENLLKIWDLTDPVSREGLVEIFRYTQAVDTGVLSPITSIRITERGGSEVEHALGSFDVTTLAGRTAVIEAINALLESLGYDRGVGSSFDTPTFNVYTDYSEIVFEGFEAAGNVFIQDAASKFVGFVEAT